MPTLILTDFLLADILGIITEINEPEWIPFSNQPNPSLRRDIRLTDGWQATHRTKNMALLISYTFHIKENKKTYCHQWPRDKNGNLGFKSNTI